MLTPKNVELTSAVSRSTSLTRCRRYSAADLRQLIVLVRQHQLAKNPVPRSVLAGGLGQVVVQGPLGAGHEHGVELGRLVPPEAG